jgi:hypothetical protein
VPPPAPAPGHAPVAGGPALDDAPPTKPTTTKHKSCLCHAADLDLESKLWLKIRLAPMCPWIGTLGLGFVGAPSSECSPLGGGAGQPIEQPL